VAAVDASGAARKQRFYDGIAGSFDAMMNPYDLQQRLWLVCHDLLAPGEVRDRRVLDVGCGTGWFSREMERAGGRVVALDIGVNLLEKVAAKCGAARVAADACRLAFADESFDVVISSECIEHTVDPLQALAEMCRVLKPGGVLVVTVPNEFWRWAEVVARVFKLRPYEGLENWLWRSQLVDALQRSGMTVELTSGVHLFPPVIPWTWPLLRRVDRGGRRLGPVMVNLAAKARKQEARAR
jgi:2-polyprenyl-6-hydroxyphenyl methylase/3-demethylubiquinone-9 3-methyltransferase